MEGKPLVVVILLTVLLAVSFNHYFKLLIALGYFRVVNNHAPGPCVQMSEIAGSSEDIDVTPDGIAFITSGSYANITDKGRIYIYDVTKQDSKARELQHHNFDDSDFWPHGLDTWIDPVTGDVILFVVNHQGSGLESVEKFLYQPKPEMLVHLQTITDPTMDAMNDIIAIDGSRFYFTNFVSGFENMYWEVYLRLPKGSLVYFDGSKGHVVHHDLLCNGVNLSNDGKYLYLALFTEGIKVFRRSFSDNKESLQFMEMMEIPSGVDNIQVVMETGDVWTAGNAWYGLIDAWKNRSSLCSGTVLRFKAEDGHLVNKREVYANDGSEVKCPSVATRYKDHLLIGNVFSPPLHCIIKAF